MILSDQLTTVEGGTVTLGDVSVGAGIVSCYTATTGGSGRSKRRGIV